MWDRSSRESEEIDDIASGEDEEKHGKPREGSIMSANAGVL